MPVMLLARFMARVAAPGGDDRPQPSVLLHTMLAKSGYRLVIGPGDTSVETAIEDTIATVADGGMGYDQLLVWFKPRIERI